MRRIKQMTIVLMMTIMSVMVINSTVKAEDEYNLWEQVVPEQTDYVGAAGTTASVTFTGLAQITTPYTVEITNENEAVAIVDDQYQLKFISAGYTTITFNFFVGEDVVKTLYVRAYTTNPQLLQKDYYVANYQSFSLAMTGIDSFYSKVTITSSNANVVTAYSWDSLTANKSGVATLTINVDGVSFICRIIVSSPKINVPFIMSYKGTSKTIKLTGQSGVTKATYVSSNPKVATVSSKGVVKTKKIGKTTITISVDNIKLKCPVEVTYKRAYQMIKQAEKVLGYKYSQARRMSKKYFDCSSLVWRMYKKVGVNIGGGRTAPTAADEAKSLVRNKKVIAKHRVSTSKLMAGDLLFFKGKYNARYKNIYHTAIYVGNGLIIHANGYYVAYGSYSDYYYRNNIAVIARPLK